MLVIFLALGSAASSAAGIFLTKSLAARFPIWQTIGPLFAINALLAAPLVALGGPWQTGRLAVVEVHLISALLLIIATGAMFALITRSSASAVGVAQALSPAATLLVAPMLLVSPTSSAKWLAVLAVVAGGTWSLRKAFTGLSSSLAMVLMLAIAITGGLLTVLTRLLAEWGVGLTETYIVRAALAAAFFLVVAPPRDLSFRVIPMLTLRAFLITAGVLLGILAIQRGDVTLIQSVLATTPLFILLMESIAYRQAPQPSALAGAGVVCLGAGALMWLG